MKSTANELTFRILGISHFQKSCNDYLPVPDLLVLHGVSSYYLAGFFATFFLLLFLAGNPYSPSSGKADARNRTDNGFLGILSNGSISISSG